jgi:hypothetical protein
VPPLVRLGDRGPCIWRSARTPRSRVRSHHRPPGASLLFRRSTASIIATNVAPRRSTHRSQCRRGERRAGERREPHILMAQTAHIVAACEHDSLPTCSSGGWVWQSDDVATRQRTFLQQGVFW